MEWSPLPSECRQRKDPYLALWGEKGGKASCVRACPEGIDTFNSVWQDKTT